MQGHFTEHQQQSESSVGDGGARVGEGKRVRAQSTGSLQSEQSARLHSQLLASSDSLTLSRFLARQVLLQRQQIQWQQQQQQQQQLLLQQLQQQQQLASLSSAYPNQIPFSSQPQQTHFSSNHAPLLHLARAASLNPAAAHRLSHPTSASPNFPTGLASTSSDLAAFPGPPHRITDVANVNQQHNVTGQLNSFQNPIPSSHSAMGSTAALSASSSSSSISPMNIDLISRTSAGSTQNPTYEQVMYMNMASAALRKMLANRRQMQQQTEAVRYQAALLSAMLQTGNSNSQNNTQIANAVAELHHPTPNKPIDTILDLTPKSTSRIPNIPARPKSAGSRMELTMNALSQSQQQTFPMSTAPSGGFQMQQFGTALSAPSAPSSAPSNTSSTLAISNTSLPNLTGTATASFDPSLAALFQSHPTQTSSDINTVLPRSNVQRAFSTPPSLDISRSLNMPVDGLASNPQSPVSSTASTPLGSPSTTPPPSEGASIDQEMSVDIVAGIDRASSASPAPTLPVVPTASPRLGAQSNTSASASPSRFSPALGATRNVRPRATRGPRVPMVLTKQIHRSMSPSMSPLTLTSPIPTSPMSETASQPGLGSPGSANSIVMPQIPLLAAPSFISSPTTPTAPTTGYQSMFMAPVMSGVEEGCGSSESGVTHPGSTTRVPLEPSQRTSVDIRALKPPLAPVHTKHTSTTSHHPQLPPSSRSRSPNRDTPSSASSTTPSSRGTSPASNPTSTPSCGPVSTRQVRPTTVQSTDSMDTTAPASGSLNSKFWSWGSSSSEMISTGEERRSAHKASEQKRREQIRDCFEELRGVVPAGFLKQSVLPESSSSSTSNVEASNSAGSGKGRGRSRTSDDGGGTKDKELNRTEILQVTCWYIAHLQRREQDLASEMEKLRSELDALKTG
ncbi:hypothetical protein HK102_002762 [Quaeritorhiza haematococci]|nr:hypothetical protein HK102_002762 [Quaeritorhiza haematococci]